MSPCFIARRFLAVALAVLSAGTCAQTPGRQKADPLDAKADVPRLLHEPSLARYKRYSEQPVGSWREANDTVNRIGGWRAYAREANEPSPAASAAAPASAPARTPSTPGQAPAASPSTPASAGHAGHHPPRR